MKDIPDFKDVAEIFGYKLVGGEGSFEAMHQNIIDWVGDIAQKHNLKDLSVLEIGSLNVNGTARWQFTGPYIGIDMTEGPQVDKIMNAHNLEFPDDSFDVVLCLEMVEHDDAFWVTLKEVSRVLRSGGHFLLSTRGNGFPLHSHPSDYWRFMSPAGPLLLEMADCNVVTSIDDPYAPGIFVHGIRR